jgi:CBS domain-containing protein
VSLQKFCERPVVTIAPEMTIVEACQRMWEKNVGCVIAIDAGKPCGILTDRDAALKVVRERKDPQQTTVREIMTANPVCLRVDKTLHELTTLMRQHQVRRVPIVDGGEQVIGMVTLDDLLMLLGEEMSDLGQGISGTLFSPPTTTEEGFPFAEWELYR